ncbi:LGFP repeat-containing protein [Agromyces sp. NPDC058126]|uniref:LGFP repeat-containing protein n=1 Tax=Agromyces sp. NPDC058126 TaxID=3346350 RepID=UPI0036DAA73D
MAEWMTAPVRAERVPSDDESRPADLFLVAAAAIGAKRTEHGWLGEPRGRHERLGEGQQYLRRFDGGAVCWSSRTGAHEVHGPVAECWEAHGAETSILGFPITDSAPVAWPDGSTRPGGHAHFEGGSIYWSPEHGARVVRGMVRDIWALLGWERGALGLPVGDTELGDEGVLSARFEHGRIAWSSADGPLVEISGSEASAHRAGASDATSALDPASERLLGRLTPGFAPQD